LGGAAIQICALTASSLLALSIRFTGAIALGCLQEIAHPFMLKYCVLEGIGDAQVPAFRVSPIHLALSLCYSKP
jgi:hypothetical protein